MPVEYVVLNQGTMVVELWTRTISHDEVLAHGRRHLSDSSIARGASVLVDAVNASFETTLEAVHEVTDLYRRFGEELRVKKSALLVNRLTHDRAKLYERQASDCGVTVILFNSLDVACTWLGDRRHGGVYGTQEAAGQYLSYGRGLTAAIVRVNLCV